MSELINGYQCTSCGGTEKHERNGENCRAILATQNAAVEITTLRQQLADAEAQSEALRQELQNHLTAQWKVGVDYAEAFILRKQAEAVEEIVDADPDGRSEDGSALILVSEIWDYAQRLRQQADELEK